MFVVDELIYSQGKYKKILEFLKESLIKYFVETVREDLKEADFWYDRIERVIKSKSTDFICFEVRNNSEVLGFIITRILKDEFFFIRHFFILDIDDRQEVAYMLLKEASQRLISKYKINKFQNAAFTFPDDYLANPLKRIGFSILKRHNMTLNLKNFNKMFKLPPDFSFIPFNEEYMPKIAELSIQTFRNHPDASFWDEINSESLYLESLKESLTTYLLADCSILVMDENENIVAFCLIEKGFEEDDFIIQNIAVSKNYQGLGIGKALISKVLKITRDKGYKKAILTVTDGIPAQKLYESFGFKKYTSFNTITNQKRTI
ncbi:MAG: GNAT family N-acetyltransferase [Candidatus Hermodarchaeota archaeon]